MTSIEISEKEKWIFIVGAFGLLAIASGVGFFVGTDYGIKACVGGFATQFLYLVQDDICTVHINYSFTNTTVNFTRTPSSLETFGKIK